MCIFSRNKAQIAATSFASLEYSSFMQLVMVRWCAVLVAALCWVVLWTPVEDYGCITSHAQSTFATFFTFAVKSHVVHLIVVCWALLLQSFGAELIVHTRWPTEIFVHV